MDTSILIARILGLLFILIGVGVLMNQKHYGKMAARFFENAELYYFSGTFAFIAGMLLVLYHNLWVTDWRVIITLIGWMSLLKGVVRILFPTAGSRFGTWFTESQRTLTAGAILVLVLGGWLAYQGFRF